MVKTQTLHQYSSNPCRNPKIHPKFTAKNKKTLLLTQKPTKPRFSPCYFPSKIVISCHFSGKKGKKPKKR